MKGYKMFVFVFFVGVVSMESRMDKMDSTAEVEALKNELEDAKKELQNYYEFLLQALDELGNLGEMLNEKDKEIERLKKQLTDPPAEGPVNELQEIIRQLEAENGQLKANKYQMTIQIKEKDKEIKYRGYRIEQLEDEFNRCMKNVDFLEQEIAVFYENYNALYHEREYLNEEVRRLGIENDECRNHLYSDYITIEELEVENAEVTGKLNDCVKDRNVLEEDLRDSQERERACDEDYNFLYKESSRKLQVLKNQRLECEENLKSADNAIVELEKDFDVVNDKLKDCKDNTILIDGELDKAKKEKEEFKDRSEKCEVNEARLKSEFFEEEKKLKEENAGLKVNLVRCQKNEMTLKSKAGRLDKNLKLTGAKLKAKEEETEKKENDFNKTIESLKKIIIDLERNITEDTGSVVTKRSCFSCFLDFFTKIFESKAKFFQWVVSAVKKNKSCATSNTTGCMITKNKSREENNTDDLETFESRKFSFNKEKIRKVISNESLKISKPSQEKFFIDKVPLMP